MPEDKFTVVVTPKSGERKVYDVDGEDKLVSAWGWFTDKFGQDADIAVGKQSNVDINNLDPDTKYEVHANKDGKSKVYDATGSSLNGAGRDWFDKTYGADNWQIAPEYRQMTPRYNSETNQLEGFDEWENPAAQDNGQTQATDNNADKWGNLLSEYDEKNGEELERARKYANASFDDYDADFNVELAKFNKEYRDKGLNPRKELKRMEREREELRKNLVESEGFKSALDTQKTQFGDFEKTLDDTRDRILNWNESYTPTGTGTAIRRTDVSFKDGADREGYSDDARDVLKHINMAKSFDLDTQLTLNADSKSFFSGMGVVAKNPNTYLANIPEALRNIQFRKLVDKMMEGGGYDSLTKDERLVVDAWQKNAEAHEFLDPTRSNWFKGGQGAAQSIEFMAEMAVTGGIIDAASKGILKAALKKGLIKGGEELAGKTVMEGLTDFATKGLSGETKYLAEQGMKFAEGLVKAPLQSALNVPMQLRSYGDALLAFDENGNLPSWSEARKSGLFRTWEEMYTENGVAPIWNVLTRYPMKWAGVAMNRLLPGAYKSLAEMYTKARVSGVGRMMRAGGFQGLNEEVFEEFMNALIDETAGNKGAVRDFFTKDNLETLYISFAPITLIGGGAGMAQVGMAQRNYENVRKGFGKMLGDMGFDQNQTDLALDGILADPAQGHHGLVESMTRQAAAQGALVEDGEGHWDFTGKWKELSDLLTEYRAAATRKAVYDGAWKSEQDAQRRDDYRRLYNDAGADFSYRDEYGGQEARTENTDGDNEETAIREGDELGRELGTEERQEDGRMTDEEAQRHIDSDRVATVTTTDGRRMYVLGRTENGEWAVKPMDGGDVTFIGDDQIVKGQKRGEDGNIEQMTAEETVRANTTSLRDYIDGRLMYSREQQKQARVAGRKANVRQERYRMAQEISKNYQDETGAWTGEIDGMPLANPQENLDEGLQVVVADGKPRLFTWDQLYARENNGEAMPTEQMVDDEEERIEREENGEVSEEEQPSALERIPKDGNGNPVFGPELDPSLAWDGMVEYYGNEADALADANYFYNQKKDEVTQMTENKEKSVQGNTPAERKASRAAINEQIDRATKEMNFWNGVVQEAENRARAEQEQTAQTENTEQQAESAENQQNTEQTENTETQEQTQEKSALEEMTGMTYDRIREGWGKSYADLAQSLAEQAKAWGLPCRILVSGKEYEDEAKRAGFTMPDRTRSYAFGNYHNGTIYICIQDIFDYARRQDVNAEGKGLETLAHEGLAHFGLRAKMGTDEFNAYCDRVFKETMTQKQRQEAFAHHWDYNMTPEQKREYLGLDGDADVPAWKDLTDRQKKGIINGKDETSQSIRRGAADEYIASVAEKVQRGDELDGGERKFWQRVVDWFRQTFGNALTERDIADELAQVRSMAERGELGQAESARTEENAFSAEERNEGTEERTDNATDVLEGVNEKFNQELKTLTEENANSVRLYLGKPSPILRSAGIADKTMLLYGNKVMKKIRKHGFTIDDLRDLPLAVANPIAVFRGSEENTHAVLTELKINDMNILVSISVGKDNDVDFNIITSAYGKAGRGVINWILNEKLLYTDKEKTLEYLRISAPIAEAQSIEELDSAAKIIQDFDNPTLPGENSGTSKENGENSAFSAEERENMTSKQIDDEYFRAMEAGDEATMREMLDEVARRNGYGKDNSWRFYHGAPEKTDYTKDEEGGLYSWTLKDEAEDNPLRANYISDSYYASADINGSRDESMNAIQDALSAIRRGEDPTVTIYRAVPKNVREGKVRRGDWVTMSRAYAVSHGQHVLGIGDYRIIKEQVPASQLYWDGNDINEWGFDDQQDYRYRNTRNNRKLDDLVTRDDDGNVIPPSKRFNSRNADTRFSAEERDIVERKRAIDAIEPTNADEAFKDIGYTTVPDKETLRQIYESIKTVTNEKDGRVAAVYPGGFNKNYREDGLFAKAIPALKAAFKNSVLAYSEYADKYAGKERSDGSIHKAHPNVVAYHNYVGKVMIEGEEYYVRFTVAEEGKSKSRLHSSFVTSVDVYKKEQTSPNLSGLPSMQGINPKEVVDANLRDFFERARKAEEKLNNSENSADFRASAEEREFSAAERVATADEARERFGVELTPEELASTSTRHGAMMLALRKATENGAIPNMDSDAVLSFISDTFRDAPEEIKSGIWEVFSESANPDIAGGVERTLADYVSREVRGVELTDAQKEFLDNAAKTIADRLGISEDNAKYVLWQHTNAGNDLVTDEERRTMQDALGVSTPASDYEAGVDSEVRYSAAQRGNTDSARDYYEKALSSVGGMLDEVYHNEYRALDTLVDAIAAQTGKATAGWENPKSAFNQLSSRTVAQLNAYMRDFYDPMVETAAAISRELDISMDDIVEYMSLKHGLERNRVFQQRAEREAQEKGKKAPARRDWSGVTAWMRDEGRYGTVEEAEAAAQKKVDDIEKTLGNRANELWDAVRRATEESLRIQLRSGLMSRELYDRISAMFDHYIPLQGFADTTNEDLYPYYGTYYEARTGTIGKKAKGRTSKAADPFTRIGMNAQKAIVEAEKNRAKLSLYNFILARQDNDLATTGRVWYVRTNNRDADGKDIWEISAPSFSENDTQEEMQRKITEWEDRMRELEKGGDARSEEDRLSLGSNVVFTYPKDVPQHCIDVTVNGRRRRIYVKGNPRAAQAANGLLSGKDGKLSRAIQTGTRYLASIYTSLNPQFFVTNFARDIGYASANIGSKEGAGYGTRFIGNAVLASRIGVLSRRFRNGELNMDNEIERMYHEFAMNGGITGYSQMRDDKYFENHVKDALKGHRWAREALNAPLDAFRQVTEDGENLLRFAAYVTSRQAGRSVAESVADAKDATVNFNRRGTGRMITADEARKLIPGDGLRQKVGRTVLMGASLLAACRPLYAFFNVAVQGMAQMIQNVYRHPGRTATTLAGYFGLGLMQAMMHGAAAGMFGGDPPESDDWYWNLTDWERRNNIIIPTGGGNYIKIPMAQELRVFYGLGDMIGGMLAHKTAQKNIPLELLGSIGDMLPVNVFGEGGVAQSLAPTLAAPVVDVLLNTDYRGSSIIPERYGGLKPKWEYAYRGTADWAVTASRALNGWNRKSTTWHDVSPEALQHYAEGYLGGVLTFAEMTLQTGKALVTGDDVNMRSVPFVNRFYGRTGDRDTGAYLLEMNRYAGRVHDTVKTDLAGYERDRDRDAINRLRDTKDFGIYRLYEGYGKTIKDLGKTIAETEDEQRKMTLIERRNGILADLATRMEEILYDE